MGCDIHAHVEIKINGRWEHYSCPRMERWYAMFELIAGVRGDATKAITPPRGFPDDLNIVTRTCWEIEEGHTPTWLTAEELERVLRWADANDKDRLWTHRNFCYLNGNWFTERDKIWEDVRFVCWFDN